MGSHLGQSHRKGVKVPALEGRDLGLGGKKETEEKEAIAKIYGFLSETGGHPYIANQDQARLMRHLALTFSQFVLLRLEGVCKQHYKTEHPEHKT